MEAKMKPTTPAQITTTGRAAATERYRARRNALTIAATIGAALLLAHVGLKTALEVTDMLERIGGV